MLLWRGNDRVKIAGLYALGLVALALPVLFAVHLARGYALTNQQELTHGLATDFLAHISGITDQVDEATQALQRAGHVEPCSIANIKLMRKLLVRYDLLLDIGWMTGNSLTCSAYVDEPQDLGPPTFVTAKNRSIRSSIRHPIDQATTILATTDGSSGYTAMVHYQQYVFKTDASAVLAAGILSKSSLHPFLAQGVLKPQWLARVRGQRELTFVDQGAVVSWIASDKWDYGTLVATPLSEIDAKTSKLLLWLVPISLVATGLLLVVLVRLTKYQASLAAGLALGLRREEFRLVYQPIVDLADGRWVGAEALIRWRRATGEEISPALFIPAAEQAGLIGQVTQRVMELFAREAPPLLLGHPDFYIGLNMSAVDLSNEQLPALLVRLSEQTGIRPERIHVEATETAFLDAVKAAQALQAIRAAGFHVAIDDFGTGYSGLSYLTRLKVDALKIDKHFIDSIGTDSVTSHVVDSIIDLGKALGLALIAEGVEKPEQADYLKARGVRFAQGYLFSRPLSMPDLAKGLQPGASR